MTKKPKSLLVQVRELAVVVGTAIILAILIQGFLVKPYKIPSGSMIPTLQINQRVLVDRVGTHLGSPQIGDIYVFHPPASYAQGCANPAEGQDSLGNDAPRACDRVGARASSETFIKRVVGLPGDRLSIRDGHVIRNGRREADGFIVPCHGDSSCNFPGTITIPSGDYFMMGDNRPDSEDSRFWGPVPTRWIIGEAFLTYWPPSRIGTL